jgi:hypothetical protein
MRRGALALQGWLPVVLMVWLPSVAAFAAHPGAGLARRDARGFVNAGIPERRARPAAVWCARRQASIMQGWLDNFLGSPSAATTSSLPPGWSAEVDPASGSTYFYNAQTGETTWDRPADVSTTRAPSQAAAQPPADVTRVPRSYEEIHDDAIAGVLAGLDAGVQRLEVVECKPREYLVRNTQTLTLPFSPRSNSRRSPRPTRSLTEVRVARLLSVGPTWNLTRKFVLRLRLGGSEWWCCAARGQRCKLCWKRACPPAQCVDWSRTPGAWESRAVMSSSAASRPMLPPG